MIEARLKKASLLVYDPEMRLYDIHTHKIPVINDSRYDVVSILNTYPLNYSPVEADNIYYSCGIHPWYMDDADEQFKRLSDIISQERIVAVGEAGLDKSKGADWDMQLLYFRKQIELAMDAQKPLIIHCVKAWDELILLYKEYKPRNLWIIHGFRGKLQQAEQLIRLGMKLSIGEHFNPEVVKEIPIESIFFETDDSELGIMSICYKISNYYELCIDDVIEIVGLNTKYAFKL